jgi:hypothetical protein
MPAAFELPEERDKPKNVICKNCGTVATDARLACEACDASFPAPFSFDPQDELAYDGDISHFEYSCPSPEAACQACRSMDGFQFRWEDRHKYTLPVPGCTNRVCWCGIVGVYREQESLLAAAGNRDQRGVSPSLCRECGKPLTPVQGGFGRTVHDKCRKTYGYIGAHKLTDWWFSAFSEEERQYIELAYQPLVATITIGKPDADQHSLLTGARGLQIYGGPGTFLANLSEWLNKPECRHLAHRVIEHAEQIATDPLEKHDVYQQSIVINYRDRDKDERFFDAAVAACQKHIDIAPQVIAVWYDTRHYLPTHRGFEQLSIIREKQGDFSEAIRLCQTAKTQGWKGSDWDGRIARCERRLTKKSRSKNS